MPTRGQRLSSYSIVTLVLGGLVACSGSTGGSFSNSAGSTTGSGGASATVGSGGASGSGGMTAGSGGASTTTTTATAGTGGASTTTTTAATTTTTSTTATSSSGGMLDNFSFFVTSLKAMQELSGSPSGFGGDLRFGEVGAGAGLRGADKICSTIAEKSMPGSSVKGWHAFLSVTADENGNQVDAIDRIGDGPWYDRLGRLIAANKADILHDRPVGADGTIKNDFPNEDGVPNHAPDPNQGQVDNHDTLTGTNSQGKLWSATGTCKDWTGGTGNKATEGKPHVGHSWPRFNGPMGGLANMANWMSSLDESGCAPGVNLIEMGPPDPNSNTVGSGGGYGGIYCFALMP